MGDKKALSKRKGQDIRLNPKKRKFIELLLKDVKIYDAYKLAGYTGTKESAYQLKHQIKPFLEQAYEVEGLSREGYKTRLLKLLSLPCVDRKGEALSNLSFTQYKDLLLMLKDEIDRQDNKSTSRPQITAFVIQTHAQSVQEANGTKGGNIVDVKAEDITPAPSTGK